jgi:hypothetical protein
VSIRFINKEILNDKLKNDTQNLFDNYPLFNTYNFKPTIRVVEPEESEILQVKEKDLHKAPGETPDSTKVYI